MKWWKKAIDIIDDIYTDEEKPIVRCCDCHHYLGDPGGWASEYARCAATKIEHISGEPEVYEVYCIIRNWDGHCGLFKPKKEGERRVVS